MRKDGKCYDNNRTRQKFCGPFKNSSNSCPCNHEKWNNGIKSRGCTSYVTLPDDYRLSIDCDCISSKKFILCIPNLNVIILVSSQPCKSVFGFTMQLLIFLFLQLLLLLLSLKLNVIFVLLNPLSVFFDFFLLNIFYLGF